MARVLREACAHRRRSPSPRVNPRWDASCYQAYSRSCKRRRGCDRRPTQRSTAMSSNAGTDDLEQMRKQLFGDFEEMLGNQGNIDAADRDSLLRHFRDALAEQSAASEPVDVERMQADAAQTLDLMQQHGLIDSQDSTDMGEAFARALQPL